MAKKRLRICDIEEETEDLSCRQKTPGCSQSQVPSQPEVHPQSQVPQVHDNFDEMVEPEVEVNVTGDPVIQRKRGITRMVEVWTLPAGQKIVVDFNKLIQPIGKEGGVLHRFLGTVVRKPNLVPINCYDWRHMDAKYKDSCWEIIESKFFFPSDPVLRQQVKKYIMKKLGDMWKNYKCELKGKYFDITLPRTAIVSLAPSTVNRVQFAELVDFWLSDEGKKRSATNKRNREKQTEIYTAGSKTIAQYASEMVVDKLTPSRGNMYPLIRTKKDGTHVTGVATENIKKLNELAKQQPEGSQGNLGESSMWRPDDIYSQVMGKERHGRVRGVGFGPTPSMFGVSSFRGFEKLNVISAEENEKDKQINEMKERMASLEGLVASLLSKQTDSNSLQNADAGSAVNLDSQQVHQSSSRNIS